VANKRIYYQVQPMQSRTQCLSVGVAFMFCVEMAKLSVIVVMECKFKSVPKLSNGTSFIDLE